MHILFTLADKFHKQLAFLNYLFKFNLHKFHLYRLKTNIKAITWYIQCVNCSTISITDVLYILYYGNDIDNIHVLIRL